MEVATARREARISLKHSVEIADQIRYKPLGKAIQYVERLIDKKISLPNGKYYTKAAKEFLFLLNNVKANAEAKGLNVEKIRIKELKVNQGYRFIKPKSRARFRGRKAKLCYLEVVVGE